MFSFLRRFAGRINAYAGLSIPQTYVYRISKLDGWSGTAANKGGIRWAPLTAERVCRLQEIGPFDLSVGLERLQRGDCCYTVEIDGKLAHYSWVQRCGVHRVKEAGWAVTVRKGEFWIYHCRTAEWARGNGIYPATLRRIVDDHFEADYCVAWIYTSRENLASQKGIARADFGLVKTVNGFRMGTHYFCLERLNQL